MFTQNLLVASHGCESSYHAIILYIKGTSDIHTAINQADLWFRYSVKNEECVEFKQFTELYLTSINDIALKLWNFKYFKVLFPTASIVL